MFPDLEAVAEFGVNEEYEGYAPGRPVVQGEEAEASAVPEEAPVGHAAVVLVI